MVEVASFEFIALGFIARAVVLQGTQSKQKKYGDIAIAYFH